MRIPKYWAIGIHKDTDERGELTRWLAYGYSFESLSQAEQQAQTKAKRLAEIRRRGDDLNQYDYLDQPLREPILAELTGDSGEFGLVTRNRYGAIILNTANVMFIDVDLAAVRVTGLWNNLRMLFSAQARREAAATAIDRELKKIHTWQKVNGLNARVYRTRVGLRILVTNRSYDPTSPEAEALMQSIDVDPLYLRLTKNQQCFRARLTPKPWRCGADRPGAAFPYHSDQHQQRHQAWIQDYEQKSKPYGTCHLLQEDNPAERTPEAEMVIQLHDRYALVDAATPLA